MLNVKLIFKFIHGKLYFLFVQKIFSIIGYFFVFRISYSHSRKRKFFTKSLDFTSILVLVKFTSFIHKLHESVSVLNILINFVVSLTIFDKCWLKSVKTCSTSSGQYLKKNKNCNNVY